MNISRKEKAKGLHKIYEELNMNENRAEIKQQKGEGNLTSNNIESQCCTSTMRSTAWKWQNKGLKGSPIYIKTTPITNKSTTYT